MPCKNTDMLKAKLAIHFLIWVAAPLPAYLALAIPLFM